MTPGFSVIIPAHNEAAVIEQTLQSILSNKLDRVLQVIVVANGCTDDTADRARSIGGPIEVIETPLGNKIHALNLGDRAARFFPRGFMDADVLLSEHVLQRVAEAIETPGVRVAAPQCRHMYRGWNLFLAGYYQLWRSLPYVRKDVMARGFYAIDETLRKRFADFPALTADDKFIRNLARPEERRVVEGCYTTVFMPASFRDLLAVKTRWTYGNLELSEQRPDLESNDQDQHAGALRHVLARPWLWAHLPTFMLVYWYARRAARQRLRMKHTTWERAQSSRQATGRRVPGI